VDATKLSLALTEIAQTAKVGMLLDEALIPICDRPFLHSYKIAAAFYIERQWLACWLLIMISLTLSDYSTRGWVPLNH
jgi:hypothetical protein